MERKLILMSERLLWLAPGTPLVLPRSLSFRSIGAQRAPDFDEQLLLDRLFEVKKGGRSETEFVEDVFLTIDFARFTKKHRQASRQVKGSAQWS